MAARKTPDESRPEPPVIRVAPLIELKIYQISESELEKMENGPPGQVHLSFALALLPTALSVFITLQTVDIRDNRIYYGYWVAFWLLSIQGLISLVRWWTSSGSLNTLVKEIRSRMPERPGLPEQITGPAPAAKAASPENRGESPAGH